MAKLWLPLGGGVLTTALAIIIQKADHVPGIWYAWVLESPHVVPALLLLSGLLFVVAIGQARPIGTFYWRIFSFLIPAGGVSEVKIHSALWGTGQQDDVDVSDAVRRNGKRGLVISVDRHTLERDPAPPQTKRLKVAYSFLNETIWEVSRPEYSRMVLPEDKEFIERTAAEYEAKRKSDLATLREEYEAKLAASSSRPKTEARNQEEVALIDGAPKLLLESRKGGGIADELVFINDSDKAIVDPQIGPLEWKREQPLELVGSVGAIPARQTVTKNIIVTQTPSSNFQGVSLYSFMREKTAYDAETVAAVTFKDSSQRAFRTEFVLTTTIHQGQTNWIPRKTTLVPSPSAMGGQ